MTTRPHGSFSTTVGWLHCTQGKQSCISCKSRTSKARMGTTASATHAPNARFWQRLQHAGKQGNFEGACELWTKTVSRPASLTTFATRASSHATTQQAGTEKSNCLSQTGSACELLPRARAHLNALAVSALAADRPLALFVPRLGKLCTPVVTVADRRHDAAISAIPTISATSTVSRLVGTVQLAELRVALRVAAGSFKTQLLGAKFGARTAAAATAAAAAAAAAAASLTQTELLIVGASINTIAAAEPQLGVHHRSVGPFVALGHLLHPIGLRDLVAAVIEREVVRRADGGEVLVLGEEGAQEVVAAAGEDAPFQVPSDDVLHLGGLDGEVLTGRLGARSAGDVVAVGRVDHTPPVGRAFAPLLCHGCASNLEATACLGGSADLAGEARGGPGRHHATLREALEVDPLGIVEAGRVVLDRAQGLLDVVRVGRVLRGARLRV